LQRVQPKVTGAMDPVNRLPPDADGDSEIERAGLLRRPGLRRVPALAGGSRYPDLTRKRRRFRRQRGPDLVERATARNRKRNLGSPRRATALRS
jgi:hypothetical protein